MGRYFHFHLALCGAFAGLAGIASSLAASKTDVSFGVRLIERTVETDVSSQPKIQFFVRLPDGHTLEKPTAKGVLAFCTWQKDPDILRGKLASDNDPLVRYAKKHGLALITWNTAQLWQTGKSYDQISRRELQQQDYDFDFVARAWTRGVNQLCRELKLPTEGWLLYGFSGGAHWGNRLALREPERFLAVCVHVANSYDKPSRSAAQPLWLVSSGDLDRGRENATSFYHDCRDMGFPMVLKIANGLGHAESTESQKVREAFFDYALRVQKRSEETKTPPAQIMNDDLQKSGLVGDVLSQEVYRASEIGKIPAPQRVALPDEIFARQWGYLRK